jgi:tetratricopeptide (TPR) repeat protein
MVYTTLEEIYKELDYDNNNEELEYFRSIESYIVKIFNKTTPLSLVEDVCKVFWHGNYQYDIVKDHDKAIICWETCFKREHVYSALRLGIHYMDNKNYDKSINIFTTALTFAPNLFTISIENKIAYYYESIEKDLEKAVHFWTQNSKNSWGYHQAGIKLINKYENKTDKESIEKYDQGIKYAEHAVTLNDCDTMHSLGITYYQKCSYQIAIKYYKMAARKGNTQSMIRLAKYYINIENNYLEGLKYLQMAVSLKDEDAINEVKKMFK